MSRTAAFGIFAYDCLLTLDDEVELVWKQWKNNLGCWLYVLNRFAPAVWLSLETVVFFVGQSPSHKFCLGVFTADGFVFIFQTLCVQLLLQMRVYALYGCNKRIRNILAACCALEMSAMITFQCLSIAGITEQPIAATSLGCQWTGVTTYSSLVWIPSLLFEPVLCAMVVWKAWGDDIKRSIRRRKGTLSDLEKIAEGTMPPAVKGLARDSVLYFLGIFAMLIVNLIVWSIPDICRYNIYTIIPWSYIFPSIIGSRMHLHMHSLITHKEQHTLLMTGKEPLRYDVPSTDSRMRFAENLATYTVNAGPPSDGDMQCY